MYVWEQLLTNYCLDGLVYNLYHELYITMHPLHKPWYILLYSCKALTFFVKHPISLPCYCYVLITQHHPASLAIPSNPGVQNLSFGIDNRNSFLPFYPFPFHLWTNLIYQSKILQWYQTHWVVKVLQPFPFLFFFLLSILNICKDELCTCESCHMHSHNLNLTQLQPELG